MLITVWVTFLYYDLRNLLYDINYFDSKSYPNFGTYTYDWILIMSVVLFLFPLIDTGSASDIRPLTARTGLERGRRRPRTLIFENLCRRPAEACSRLITGLDTLALFKGCLAGKSYLLVATIIELRPQQTIFYFSAILEKIEMLGSVLPKLWTCYFFLTRYDTYSTVTYSMSHNN